MLIFVPSINAEAAQSRTINLGRLGLGQTVNRSLGIKLETPGSFGSRTLGGGLQLAEDPTGMLMVRGTTNAYGNVNVTVNGVRCLTNPSNPSSGDSFDFTINFEVSSQVPYRINYVDQGTGVVVFSEEGRASADNTWVNIRTEFHHSGSTYAINKAQSYPATQYKYATASNAAQVYVASASAGTDGYVTYNLISYKKMSDIFEEKMRTAKFHLVSLSFSTISFTATDCTLHAESHFLIFFHKIGLTLYQTSLSSILLAC